MILELKVEALSIRTQVTKAPREQKNMIELTLEGVVGDVHYGFTKPADGRDTGIKRGTTIRNWRQWSAVSLEEMAAISERLDVPSIDPCLLSANLMFSGMQDFTLLPRGTMISFSSGAMLLVEDENAPCTGPGKEIQQIYSSVQPHEFVAAALHKRGLVGVVHKPGFVSVGDIAQVNIAEPALYHMSRNTAEAAASK